MRLREYTPDAFESLLPAAQSQRAPSLRHRPFVDYYYSGNPWCKLYLLASDCGSTAGVMGVDLMRFAVGEQFRTLAFATNYHAFQPGAGGYLYLHWMKHFPFGFVFGGSEDTHKILRQQRWTYFPGVKTFVLNYSYPSLPGETLWRRCAKRIVRSVPQPRTAERVRRIPPAVRECISVHEEPCVTEDMLPAASPFSFRFAPPLDYLNWRYRTDLPFVRYRVFRVLKAGRTSGYVILNESPEKVIVAQCDGEDAAAVAYGVLLSLTTATAGDSRLREVILTCSHPEMQRIYHRFGFRSRGSDRPFAVGARRGPIDLPEDTSRWLVNLDWGDNGLRAPFLDQVGVASGLTGEAPLAQDTPYRSALKVHGG